MNNIVCNICGTAYSDDVAQCPVCGYAESSETSNLGERKYTHVKGGRYSKANVKKRNRAKAHKDEAPVTAKPKNNVGSIVLIVILLIAILAVSSYIALRFFIPNDFLFEGVDTLKAQDANQQFTEETPPVTENHTVEPSVESAPLECISISLDVETLIFDAIGDTYTLNTTVDPIDTQDTITFVSSDESVAMIDANGTVTATGTGNAVITASCGNAYAECSIVCQPLLELRLNRKEIDFNTKGQTWLLYNDNSNSQAGDIVWTSDNVEVATVENGEVTAVGEGTATIVAVYQEQTVSCVVHCKFEDTADNPNEISEASGENSEEEKNYMLYNPGGYATDVTINPGEKFTLKLVDEKLNEINEVQWSVNNSNICTFSENIVCGVATGTTKVTATYNGKTYTCVVRVN